MTGAKQHCHASGIKAPKDARTIIGATFVKCPECGRVLKPTPTGKLRQHQPRGRTTASLDTTRDILWDNATPTREIG